MVLEAGKGREECVEVVHADPRVSISYREERGDLERLRENLGVDERCGKSLRVDTVNIDVDLQMPCKL